MIELEMFFFYFYHVSINIIYHQAKAEQYKNCYDMAISHRKRSQFLDYQIFFSLL